MLWITIINVPHQEPGTCRTVCLILPEQDARALSACKPFKSLYYLHTHRGLLFAFVNINIQASLSEQRTVVIHRDYNVYNITVNCDNCVRSWPKLY